MGKKLELAGQKFGKLTVIEFSHVGENRKSYWKCVCECGKEVIVCGWDVKNGHTKSCGCLISETMATTATKHGHCTRKQKPPEYMAWTHIKQRCNNPNGQVWEDYGGRGIIVCDRWLNSFENFIADMGKKPFKGAEIDRIDVNGNYEPDNCRWVTKNQNCENRRKKSNNTSGYKGVSWEKARNKYRAYITVNGTCVLLGRFSNALDGAKAYDDAATKYFGEYACTNAMMGLI